MTEAWPTDTPMHAMRRAELSDNCASITHVSRYPLDDAADGRLGKELT
jgi:hypothetical protein